MTMFSGHSLYGGCYGDILGVMSQLQGGYGFSTSDGCVESDLQLVFPLAMAEDESRTESLNEESSSKEAADRDGAPWLQLGIGCTDQSTTTKINSLVELDLMPSSSKNIASHSQIRPLLPGLQPPRETMNFPGFNSPFYFQQQQQQHQGSSSSNFSPRQEINWGFRAPMMPISIAAAAAAASSSSLSSSPSLSSLMASTPYFQRSNTTASDMAAPPLPVVDFRVIQAPRRPHSGIWFMLQASQNQDKEPFLPQISKSYLRIKDGRMTIRLVLKYLVNKLRLENESEIEIRCKGQKLEPCLTLQHVRDNIWSSPPRDFITLLPNSSTTHHIMVLQYARI